MALFDNLIAYYKLDGNCRDSVNMYDGIPNNITFVDGKIGECAQTNGNSQYISLPNEVSVKGRTQVSYSGWCFIESTLSNEFYIITEIANSNDYTRAAFGVNAALLPFTGVRTVATGDTGSFQKVTGTSPMSTGTWYFLCGVFDLANGNIILYVNGVVVGSLKVTVSSFVNSDPYRIRIFEFDASGSDRVRVDELGIWSKVLSATEVSELYNNGAGKTYSTGTSGGTGVVIDGLFLSTSKPKAGDKGLLVNNKFFIPFAESSEGGSGGDTSAFESDAMAIIGTPTGGGSGGESGDEIITLVSESGSGTNTVTIVATGSVIVTNGSASQTYTEFPAEFTLSAGTTTIQGAVTALTANEADLTALDISSNSVITHLLCHDNNLTTLDVTNNTALQQLGCHNNNLTSLDVTNNTALLYLGLSGNSLTTLDISSNTLLVNLNVSNNDLTSSAINAILSALAASEVTDGYVFLQNQLSGGAPMGQGLTDIETIQSRGWTVTTA